jgi:hypothetical protein
MSSVASARSAPPSRSLSLRELKEASVAELRGQATGGMCDLDPSSVSEPSPLS